MQALKHATWWKIHLKPHVYKGFPFISLSTPPIFPYLTYLVARSKVFRLGIGAALCGCKLRQTCNLNKDAPQTHVYKGFPFISLSTALIFHISHILSPDVKRSASLNIRHCPHANSVKHATWWKIHLRSHVYKGFPFIILSTPLIFDIFCRPM